MGWSAHAGGNPRDGDRGAEHAVAADRFAREIVWFLMVSLGALAPAERQPVGRSPSRSSLHARLFLLGATRRLLIRGIMDASVRLAVGSSMIVVYRLQGVEFEWDDQKAQRNIMNHNITFEEAAEVFFDPFYQYGDATPAAVQEQRDFILGYSVAQRLLLVVSTERHDRTRIVSA